MRRAISVAGAGAVLLSLAGCGSMNVFGGKKEAVDPTNVAPPEAMYTSADTLLERRRYDEAAKKFEEVDRDHPYAPQARRAVVMSAYANYKNGKFDEAIGGAQRYLTLHPGTEEADLAQNIIAMSYYDQIKDPRRDQSTTKKALDAYETLVQRYPDSRYAETAQNRIRTTRDLMAANEMTVGRYYLKEKNYLAAINRFRTVVSEYQTTPQVEEALLRLVEAYMAMGVVNEAQTAAAVLGHNFPDSKWYKSAYALLGDSGLQPQEHQGSWMSRQLSRIRG
jgi:outer membrane protein assembly factor BamD